MSTSLNFTGTTSIASPTAADSATAGAGATVTVGAGGSLTTVGDLTLNGAMLTLNGAPLAVGGALSLTGNYDYGIFNGATVTLGSIWEAGNYLSVSVAGGHVTTGKIGAQSWCYATYQVSGAGSFEVLGDEAVKGGDNIYVMGTGKFTVDGTAALGADFIQASGSGAVWFKHVSGPADGVDTVSVSGSASVEFGPTGGAQAGSLTLDAGVTITEGASITAQHIVLGSGSVLRTGAGGHEVLNTAYVSGKGYVGDITGPGTLEVDAGGRLDVNSTSVGADVTFDLLGGGDTLYLKNPLGYGGGSIKDFTAGDAVAFAGAWSMLGVAENAAGTVGTLTLESGANHVALAFAGAFSASDFHVASGATTTVTHA